MTEGDEKSNTVLYAVHELAGGRTGTPVPVSDVAARLGAPAEQVRAVADGLLRDGRLQHAVNPATLYLSPMGRSWVGMRPRGSGCA